MAYYTVEKNHACSYLDMGFYRPPNGYQWLNYNENRPEGIDIDTVVIHYTVSDYARSYTILAHDKGGRSGPSVHYMIATDGRIDNLVDDSNIAWHAGVSYWDGKNSINQNSIGIELINPGSGDSECFPIMGNSAPSYANCKTNPFPEEQLSTVIQLVECLKMEHNIKNFNIVGHSDIAPSRKIDPGVLFPWHELANENLGLYSRAHAIPNKVLYKYGDETEDIEFLKKNLTHYGYKIKNQVEENEKVFDENLSVVVRAFHFHFNVDVVEEGFAWDDWTATDAMRLEELILMKEQELLENEEAICV